MISTRTTTLSVPRFFVATATEPLNIVGKKEGSFFPFTNEPKSVQVSVEIVLHVPRDPIANIRDTSAKEEVVKLQGSSRCLRLVAGIHHPVNFRTANGFVADDVNLRGSAGQLPNVSDIM
jgi:hypothetical protein